MADYLWPTDILYRVRNLTNMRIGGIFATMRIVLDTNILVAASRSKTGASFRILSLIPDERFQLCLSYPLYLEYLDVLTRPQIRPTGISNEQVYGTVRYITSHAHLQEIHFQWRPFLSDPNDDMVLELAVAARVSTIVTFNLKDFRGIDIFGINVMKPGEFLAEIGAIS